MKLHVYTRPVDAEKYPAGLAHSVHLACEAADGKVTPFNKNYGILFPQGRISDQNTIVPLGGQPIWSSMTFSCDLLKIVFPLLLI